MTRDEAIEKYSSNGNKDWHPIDGLTQLGLLKVDEPVKQPKHVYVIFRYNRATDYSCMHAIYEDEKDAQIALTMLPNYDQVTFRLEGRVMF